MTKRSGNSARSGNYTNYANKEFIPEPKKQGEWIKRKDGCFKCSVCGKPSIYMFDECACCGSDMNIEK